MLALIASFALASAAIATPPPTRVRDAAALHRLRRNSGVTLQWLSFESPRRGQLRVSERGGIVRLTGGQRVGRGRLTIDGEVVEIGPRSFTFRGSIQIDDAPDAGRNCRREGEYEFRATGTRRYWRLQQMEVCDGLTDYVDIYF